jgi:Luciferase-like monooxygenase
MSWKVGMVIPDQTSGGATLTGQARLIEQLGFDWICCGEHVLFSVPIANAFVTLAHTGAIAESIELLSGVTFAALYPAAQIAKMAATLGITSGGRFNLGIGVAGEYPNEFAACGIPRNERGSRTDEALQIVRQLWTGDVVDFEGRYATVKGRMRPRPIRRSSNLSWRSQRSFRPSCGRRRVVPLPSQPNAGCPSDCRSMPRPGPTGLSLPSSGRWTRGLTVFSSSVSK